MKHIIALVLALLSSIALAAPTLYADPYPATGVQPDAASLTINGGTPIPCTLKAVTGGLQPQCDLASITSPGDYTLVLTVSKAGGITNTTGGATNTVGSTASSAPFVYRLRTAPVLGPTLTVGP